MKRCLLKALLLVLCIGLASIHSFASTGVIVPNEKAIAMDLIGRTITEGTENGYFPADWKWHIEADEIQELSILSDNVSDDYYSCIVQITLKSKSSPTKYRAILQVDYTLHNNQWLLTIVQSKGVNVVATDKYYKCISTKIDDDGWGGINCLKIKNNIDTSLLVGGVYRTNESHEWHKFSVILDGLKVVGVGGTFSYGSVVDYRIHFVELY